MNEELSLRWNMKTGIYKAEKRSAASLIFQRLQCCVHTSASSSGSEKPSPAVEWVIVFCPFSHTSEAAVTLASFVDMKVVQRRRE